MERSVYFQENHIFIPFERYLSFVYNLGRPMIRWSAMKFPDRPRSFTGLRIYGCYNLIPRMRFFFLRSISAMAEMHFHSLPFLISDRHVPVSTYLCVTPFFSLAPFGFINTFILSHSAHLRPFPTAMPKIRCKVSCPVYFASSIF